MTFLSFPLAVHLSDGVLSPVWLIAGFAGMGLLMLPAMMRVRDEEIPRIALLTAAFFVASLLHVRLGPTSVHLLLNGLVGVILGWRAGLAIPVGLTLQALLLGHGGFLTLGVNSCVLTVPALLMGGLYHLLQRVAWTRHRWLRALLTAGVAALVQLALFAGLVMLLARMNGSSSTWFYPGLSLVVLGSILAAWAEQRLEQQPDFAVGCVIGLVGVLLTLLFNGLVLLYGGAEDWNAIVLLVFAAHLPVAVLEAVILGFTVSFLTRVKPDLLGALPPLTAPPVGWAPVPVAPAPVTQAIKGPIPLHERPLPGLPGQSSAGLVVLVALLLLASPAQAHRLEAKCTNLRWVEVESWFETGDSPQQGTVQVFGPDGKLLLKGNLDAEGKFTFPVDRSIELKVVVNAEGGHREELILPPETATAPQEPAPSRIYQVPYRDALAGVALLLAVGSFWMCLRNARELREIRRVVTSAAGTPLPATPPTDPAPG